MSVSQLQRCNHARIDSNLQAPVVLWVLAVLKRSAEAVKEGDSGNESNV
jgi:hypothetical protein